MVNSMFNLSRDDQNVSQSGFNILHSHQQCIRILISPHSPPELLSDFSIVANPVAVKWEVTVVFGCFSLMANDFEPHFMHLLAICISFLQECLFISFVNFVTGLYLLLLSFISLLCILILCKSLNRYTSYKYFVPFSAFPFHFLNAAL